MKQMFPKFILERIPYSLLDKYYLKLDKQHIRKTKNIRLIPNENKRKGGKYSYAEWAHVIGIFQTLFFIHLTKHQDNSILDIGCGTGLLGIAGEPFLGENGNYVGVDVKKRHIDFCRNYFDSSKFHFIHLEANNPAYASHQKTKQVKWEVASHQFDLITALSVWTHLNEEDALFYFKEVSRGLKPMGKAIITFFLLDEAYEKTLPLRSKKKGRYHMSGQNRWIFDRQAYGSSSWFCPTWAKIPEEAIGVTSEGLENLLKHTLLEKIAYYPGNWKEIPGMYFQDIVVFQKC